MDKLVTALRAWLAIELADWGTDDQQLTIALDNLATSFVEQDPELSPMPGASFEPVAPTAATLPSHGR